MGFECKIKFPGDAGWTDLSLLLKDEYTLDLGVLSDDFRHVRSTCSVKMVDDPTIRTKLLNSTGWIDFYLTKDGTRLFTGLLRSDVSTTVSNALDYIALDAIDYTDLLDIEIPFLVGSSDWKLCHATTSKSYLHQLLSNVTARALTVSAGATPDTLGQIAFRHGSKLSDVLDQLCWEYGYQYYFDAMGEVQLVRWMASTSTTTYDFTSAADTVINGTFQADKRDDPEDSAKVAWRLLEKRIDQNLGVKQFGQIKNAGTAFPDDPEWVLSWSPPENTATDTSLDDLTPLSITPTKIFHKAVIHTTTLGNKLSEWETAIPGIGEYWWDKYPIIYGPLGIVTEKEKLSETEYKLRVTVAPTAPNSPLLTIDWISFDKVGFLGDVWFTRYSPPVYQDGTREVRKEYESKHIHQKKFAEALAQGIRDNLLTSGVYYTFSSYVDRPVGENVAISLTNKGFATTGKILRKKYDWQSREYQYTVKGLSAVSVPATTYSPNLTEPAVPEYFLIPNVTAMTRRSTDAVYNPGTLILDAQVREGYLSRPYSGHIQIDEWNGTAWTTTYTSTSDETGKEYTPSATCQGIRAGLYKSGGTITQLDSKEITVSIVWPVTSEGLPASPVTYTPGTLEVTHSISGRGFSASWGKVPSTLDLLRYEVQISTDGSSWHGFDPVTMAGWDKDTLDAWTPSGGSYLSTTTPRLVIPLPLTKNANGTRSDRTWHLRFRQVSTTPANGAYTTITVKATATGAGDVAANAINQGQIDLANWLNSQPIQQGLLAHWSFDDVPDYPTAGATYVEDAWPNTSGWVAGNGAVLSISTTPGALRASGVGTDGFIQKTGSFAGKLIFVKYRGTDVPVIGIYTGSWNYNWQPLPASQEWNVVSYLFPANVSTIMFRGHVSGFVEYDWIYIGTGAYTNPLKDQSGNNRSLTLQGGPLAVRGVNGKALLFNGSTSKAVLPNGNPNIATGSVCLWFKADTTGGYTVLISGGSPGITQGLWYILLGNGTGAFPDESVSFVSFDSSGTINKNSFVHRGGHDLYRDNKLHFVSVTQDGTGIKIYMDGMRVSVEFSTRDDTFFLNNGNRDVVIGRYSYGDSAQTCEVDEVRIYNRALSEAEIRYLYTNPGGPVPAIFGAERIAAGSITANEIASKALTTGQLAVDQISNMAPSSSSIDKSKNYWDLVTGGFRVGTADKYILFNPADTTNPITVVGNTSFVGSTLPWSQVSDKPNFGSMSLKNSVENADVTSIDGGKITTGFISADRIQSGSMDGKITQIDGGKITTGQIKSTGHDSVPSSSGTRTRMELDNAKFFLETYLSTVLKLQLELSSNGLIAKHSGNTVFSVDATTGDVTFGDYAGEKGMKWLAATGLFVMIGCSLTTGSGNFGDLTASQVWKGWGTVYGGHGSGVRASEIITYLQGLTGKTTHYGTAYCGTGVLGAGLAIRRLSWSGSSLGYDNTTYASGDWFIPPGATASFYVREIYNPSSFRSTPIIKSGLHQVNTGDTTRGAIWTALNALGWDVGSMHVGYHDSNGDGAAEPVSVYRHSTGYMVHCQVNNWSANCVSGDGTLFGGRLWVM